MGVVAWVGSMLENRNFHVTIGVTVVEGGLREGNLPDGSWSAIGPFVFVGSGGGGAKVQLAPEEARMLATAITFAAEYADRMWREHLTAQGKDGTR